MIFVKKIESLPCVEFVKVFSFSTLPTQPWPAFPASTTAKADDCFERGHGSIKILSAGYKNIDLCIADGFDVVVHSTQAKAFCCLFRIKSCLFVLPCRDWASFLPLMGTLRAKNDPSSETKKEPSFFWVKIEKRIFEGKEIFSWD